MPSFDIVSKIDMPSVQNALDGVKKEINTRYDFKGSACEVEQQEDKIIIKADDELKRKQVEELSLLENLGDFSRLRTIWEFDELVTAPLNGFKNALDYYEQCSSLNFLSSIKTETLLIQSKDDPLIPGKSVPLPESLNSNIQLQLNSAGGHVGFIAGYRERWLETQLLNYLVS